MDADNTDFVQVTRSDAGLLLEAAESGWDRPVPHCPDWDLAQLVRHTGGIFTWMAAVVAAREQVSRRTLPAAPAETDELAAWYRQRLGETLHLFATTDPATETWTFSSLGDHRVGWWVTRLAVEVSIHRWDAQHATGAPAPAPLDGEVAAVGIEEFLTEFLPGLLTRAAGSGSTATGLTGTLHLHATDGATEWFIDLDDPARTAPEHRKADTAIRASRSDLLLWLTNREPADLDVIGNPDPVRGWTQLNR